MLTYAALPGDVDHMIADDHAIVERQFQHLESGRGDSRVLADQSTFELSLHATAEERVVYPALRDAGLAGAVDEAIAEHQEMKELLVILTKEEPDDAAFDAALTRLMQAVRDHVKDEEQRILPQMRAALGAEEMAAMGERFLAAKRSAPTQAHPNGPSSGIGHALTDTVARWVDTLRDVTSGRQERLATDGSRLLTPDAQRIIDTYSALDPKPVEILTVDEARAQPGLDVAVQRRMHEDGLPIPEPVGSVEDLSIPAAMGQIQTLRVYRPDGDDGGAPRPIVMWIHGGGWVLHDIDTYDASCRGLCNKTGAIVVSPNYRRAPEATFPSSHDDVLEAWHWVAEHAVELGGDASAMAIGGESVGGTMAAATCLTLVEDGRPVPRAAVCVYPLTTPLEFGESMIDSADARPLNKALLSWMAMHAFLGAPESASDPRVDLLARSPQQLAAMPPTLVIVADRDPLRSQGEAFADALRSAGVDVACTRYPGTMHEFFGAAAVLPEAERAQQEAAAHLGRALAA